MNWRQWLETLLDFSWSEIVKQCQKRFPLFELSSNQWSALHLMWADRLKERSRRATLEIQPRASAPRAGPPAQRHWGLLEIRSMDSSRSLYWKISLLWCLWAFASTKASRLFKFSYLHPAYLIQHWEHPFPVLAFFGGNGDPVAVTEYPKIWLPAPLSSDGMSCWCWSAVRSEQTQSTRVVWARASPPSCASWCLVQQNSSISTAFPSAHPLLALGTSNPLLAPSEPGQNLFLLPLCSSARYRNTSRWQRQIIHYFTLMVTKPALHTKSKCLHNYMILYTWIPHGSLSYYWMRNTFLNAMAISRLKKSVEKTGYI